MNENDSVRELVERLHNLCDAENNPASPEWQQGAADGLHDAASLIEQQAREIAGLRKDAERYAWLRASHIEAGIWVCSEALKGELRKGPLDEAIDAAMREGK